MGGLETDDIIVLTGAGYLVGATMPNLNIKAGPVDLTFLVAMGVIAAFFSLWLVFRKDKPRYFLRDLLRLLGEPDIWSVTPDIWTRPCQR